MINIKSMTPKDKKKLLFLILWLIAGLGMLAIGIAALVNRDKTIETVSGIIAVCALITGVVTLGIRLFDSRTSSGKIAFDGLIWIGVSVLFFNTNILNRLGRVAFIAIGGIIVLEGIRAFLAAHRERNEEKWFMPRIVFSGVFVIVGLLIFFNAESIFKSMTVFVIGVYFIVHGLGIINDWIGRYKYFINFRGVDDE